MTYYITKTKRCDNTKHAYDNWNNGVLNSYQGQSSDLNKAFLAAKEYNDTCASCGCKVEVRLTKGI